MGKNEYLTFMDPVVTRLSSKGQVVIPASIRQRLGLVAGDALRVTIGPPGEPSIILRRPTPDEVQSQIERGYRWLERHDEDPIEALHESRRAARAREDRRR
jgi:AbrB family looped-hinge helix DNA binding protein